MTTALTAILFILLALNGLVTWLVIDRFFYLLKQLDEGTFGSVKLLQSQINQLKVDKKK